MTPGSQSPARGSAPRMLRVTKFALCAVAALAGASIVLVVTWSRHLPSPAGAIALQLVGCALAAPFVFIGGKRVLDPTLPIVFNKYRSRVVWTSASTRTRQTEIVGQRKILLSRTMALVVIATGAAVYGGGLVASLRIGRRVDLPREDRFAIIDLIRAQHATRPLRQCLTRPAHVTCIGTYHLRIVADRVDVVIVKPNACDAHDPGAARCLERELATPPRLTLARHLRDRLGPVGADIEVYTHVSTLVER